MTTRSNRSDMQWWEEPEGQAASRVTEAARHLETRAAHRRTWTAIYHRVTTGREPIASMGFAMSNTGAIPASFDNYQHPTYNALASCIESLTSFVGKSRPWAMFATDDAPFEERVRAKQASKFCWHLMLQLGAYTTGAEVFTSGLRLGLGAAKVVYDDVSEKPTVEFVNIDELLWDDVEVAFSPDGLPRTLYHRRFVDRVELEKLYPEQAAAIATANGAVPGVVVISGIHANRYIAVVEAWRRPGSDGADGRHVLCVGDTTLVDEDWEEGLPFAFFRGWDTVPGQFMGIGIAEAGYGTQRELNRLYAVLTESHKRVGVPWLLVDERSQVQTAQLGNRVATIVKWNSQGAKPEVVTHNAASADTYSHIDRLKADIYKRFGVSDMMAAAQKPGGMQSGEALRTLADQSTARHIVLGRRLETFYMDVAKLLLRIAEKHKLQVDVGERWGGKLSWDGIKPSSEPMAFPLSSLPLQPEGRIQQADEWLQRGIIDREEYARIADWPDSGRAKDLLTAARDNIEWQLDDCVLHNRYRQPEKFQDLKLLIRMAQERILYEQTRGCPETRLDLIRQLVDEADALDKATNAQPAPAAAAPAPANTNGAPAAAPAPGFAPVNPNAPFGAAA